MRRVLAGVAAAFALIALSGCALAPLGAPIPSVENIGKARAAGLPPMALGTFTLAPGQPADMDQKISIRSNKLYSPYGSSFAAYLKQSLASDLHAAGLLDPAAPVVIAGQLTDSRIEVPVGPASATVAARFSVTRSGQVVYAKELRARAAWEAGFVGAQAVPEALNRYEQLYRQLTAMLLGDPEFQVAVKR